MTSTYLNQLSRLGILPSQFLSLELATRLSGSEHFVMIDIQPDTTPGKVPEDDPTPDADFNVALYFSLDNSTRTYRLTHYVATLYYADSGDIFRCRTFPVIRQPAIPTFREAKNLLQGRSVLKRFCQATPLEYEAWLRLDFLRRDDSNEYKMEQYRSNRWRVLKTILAMYPIAEMEDPTLSQIIVKALHTGELIEISLHEGTTAISKKIVTYDPRSPLLKFLTPRNYEPTLVIHQIKEHTLWLTL